MYITFSDKIEINTISKINDFINHLDSSLQNYADSHDFEFYKIDTNTRSINVSTMDNCVFWYNIIYNISHNIQTVDIYIIPKNDDLKVKTISIRLNELSNENIINIVVSHIDAYIN